MAEQNEELQATAYHESGHVVAAIHLEVPFLYATIKEKDGAAGHVMFTNNLLNLRAKLEFEGVELTIYQKSLVDKDVIIYYAGGLAERRFTGKNNLLGASSDSYNATDWGLFLHSSPNVASKYLKYQKACADDIVNNRLYWKQIKLIADELLEKETITYKKIKVLLLKSNRSFNGLM